MAFIRTTNLCLKLWSASITSVPVKRCVHLSLKIISNVAVRRESSMTWDETIYRKKSSLSLKFRSVNDGEVKSVRDNQMCWTTYLGLLSLHTLNCGGTTNRRRVKPKTELAMFNATLNYPKNWDPTLLTCRQSSTTSPLKRVTWRHNEKICRRRKNIVSTSEGVDPELHVTKHHIYDSSLVILFWIGYCLCKKNTTKTMKLLGISFYGLEPTYCDEIPDRWKVRCSNQHMTFQKTQSPKQHFVLGWTHQSTDWTSTTILQCVRHSWTCKTTNVRFSPKFVT